MSRSKHGIALVLTVVFLPGLYQFMEQNIQTEYRITQTGGGVGLHGAMPETTVALKVLPHPTVSPTTSAMAVTVANAVPTQQSSPNSVFVNTTVASVIPKTCFMELCNFHAAQAPRLWVAEHTDGAGHRMKNVIQGFAVAQKAGMNLGGVVALKHPLTDQHVNYRKLALGFFGGVKDSGGLFYFNESGPPKWDAKVNGPRELEAQRSNFPPGAFVWMPSASEWSLVDGKASQFFPAKLRAGLARPFASQPLKFAPNRPTVAMHLRRADLHRDDPRVTPNEYYYWLADLIRTRLPTADIHIWAAIKNIPSVSEDYWNATEFDGFKKTRHACASR